MALTSIIIPTHNRPGMIPRAVESARRAGSEVEIVVIDDGSTDATREVCAGLSDIVYVRLERRRGVAFARSAGIAASSGTYISFLDDDDERVPGSIDRQVAVLEELDAALVYGQMYRATQSLSLHRRAVFPRLCPAGDVFWTLLGNNFIPACSVVVRRSAIDAVGGLDDAASPSDDWDLWLRVAERARIAALPEPVAIHRVPTLWSRQASSRLGDGLLFAARRVLARAAKLQRAAADPRAFRRAARSIEGALALRLLAQAFDAARRGDSYALVSLRLAAATPAAFLVAFLSPQTWMKLGERLRS